MKTISCLSVLQAEAAAKNATKTEEPAKGAPAKPVAAKQDGKPAKLAAQKLNKRRGQIQEYEEDTVASEVGAPKGFTVCDKNSLKEMPMPA